MRKAGKRLPDIKSKSSCSLLDLFVDLSSSKLVTIAGNNLGLLSILIALVLIYLLTNCFR